MATLAYGRAAQVAYDNAHEDDARVAGNAQAKAERNASCAARRRAGTKRDTERNIKETPAIGKADGDAHAQHAPPATGRRKDQNLWTKNTINLQQ